VIASYCAVAWLAYGILAFYGAPLVGDQPLQWQGLPRTYLAALLRVPPQFVGAVAVLVGGVVLAVSAWRAWRFRLGGAEVARWIGARYVDPERCSPSQRKLLNVVSEMSIASGAVSSSSAKRGSTARTRASNKSSAPKSRASPASVADGTASGIRRYCCSSGARSGSWLVASSVTFGAPRSIAATSDSTA
jgi:hypothetical protein